MAGLDPAIQLSFHSSDKGIAVSLNKKPAWRRIVWIGSGMVGVAIILILIDSDLFKVEVLELPIAALWSIGVLCLLIAGAVRWFTHKR